MPPPPTEGESEDDDEDVEIEKSSRRKRSESSGPKAAKKLRTKVARKRAAANSSDKAASTSTNSTPKPIPRRGLYPSLEGAALTKAFGMYGTDTSTLKKKVAMYDKDAVSNPDYMPNTEKMLAIIVYHDSN